jgi:hypothetical protein
VTRTKDLVGQLSLPFDPDCRGLSPTSVVERDRAVVVVRHRAALAAYGGAVSELDRHRAASGEVAIRAAAVCGVSDCALEDLPF